VKLAGIYILSVVALFSALKLGLIPTTTTGSIMETAIPLGFSFVMFHSIALILDRAPIQRLNFSASALFFPTLAIGPFHKLQTFEKSLEDRWNGKRLFQGYCLVCLGAFKLGISGVLLKPYFLRGMPIKFQQDINFYNTAVIFLMGSVFLYANFSGYSDLVCGFARMLGFEVPPNFRFPFLARSMADYWRNWHISLGAWFREYVFMPLNYKLATHPRIKWNAALCASISVFVTFFLIGIWHDFSIKILLYALANSALVAFFIPQNKNAWIGIPLTFILALLINGIFLSQDLTTFKDLLSQVHVPPQRGALHINLVTTVLCLVLLALFYGLEKLIEALQDESYRYYQLILAANYAVCAMELFAGISLGIGRADPVYIGY
jgi:alginate O-acetyltransferase complex protein AlgI